jgi:hypothetical protein
MQSPESLTREQLSAYLFVRSKSTEAVMAVSRYSHERSIKVLTKPHPGVRHSAHNGVGADDSAFESVSAKG